MLKYVTSLGLSYDIIRYSLFWVLTQRILVVTDVSGQPIVPVFKGQVVQEE
jgi:hypothetical protein